MAALAKRLFRYKYLYLLLLPGFLATVIFAYIPMYGLYMAFSDYQLGLPILKAPFVGLDNFVEFLQDSASVLNLLKNTIGMNILSLVVGLGAAVIFAVLLNEVRIPWLKKVVQTSSFFPFFISWVIVYNIFQVFLSVDSGVINIAMKNAGLIKDGVNYLGDPAYSWGLIVLSNLWKMLGYNSVIFLAAISGIDQQMYEAATIDGADRLQKIWYITLPELVPTLQILLILNVGYLFGSNFDQYYLFTNGVNRDTMEVFDMYIYRFGLQMLRYSYATAVGIAKAVAGSILMVLVNMLSKKLNGKGIA